MDAGERGVGEGTARIGVAVRTELATHGPELAREITVASQDGSQEGIAAAIQVLELSYDLREIDGARGGRIIGIIQFGIIRFYSCQALAGGLRVRLRRLEILLQRRELSLPILLFLLQ